VVVRGWEHIAYKERLTSGFALPSESEAGEVIVFLAVFSYLM